MLERIMSWWSSASAVPSIEARPQTCRAYVFVTHNLHILYASEFMNTVANVMKTVTQRHATSGGV